MLDHEQVVVRSGRRSRLPVIVAVHSTALGPAAGGLRLWHYPRLAGRPHRRAAPVGGDDRAVRRGGTAPAAAGKRSQALPGAWCWTGPAP
ncbi:hypothetical protein LT493_16725 [Streptomyces tricolor]|nr:hypothetical protein [Streptomyces tricolor]